MTKYLVTGTYTYKQVVDTDDPYFLNYSDKHPLKNKITQEQMVESFAEHDLDNLIIDDDGESGITAGSLDWTAEEIQTGGRVS